MRRLTALLSLVCFSVSSLPAASAQVELAQVDNGDVTVQHEGSTYTITASDQAIANFSHLSTTPEEILNFNLPSSASSILNRVIGADPSDFLGSLFSNGNVFILNPNGIHFGADAAVNVHGLVASTLGLSNENFLAGNYALARDPSMAAGFILNEGQIQAARQGFVALVGGAVQNTGKITADGGTVSLASADRVTLGIDGGLVSVVIEDPIHSEVRDLQGNLVKDLIANSGAVQANGGKVILSAKAAEEVFDHIINHTGIIEAKSLREENGRMILDGGSEGTVRVAGTLDASGKNPAEKGGAIQILGDKVKLAAGAKVDASGDRGGGSVLIGGDLHGKGSVQNARETTVAPGATLEASALSKGDGGRVIIWSDETTRFYGKVISRAGAESGNGGFAEISGKENLDFRGDVNLEAPQGVSGTLLLDPSFLTITDTADGTGNLDGELTPDSDPELLAGVPDDPVFNSVSRGQLEAFGPTANIILETTGLLRVRDIASNVIALSAATGSVRLSGQSLTFNDPNDVIRTEGGAITAQALLSQGKITGGGFDTTGASGTKSGAISLQANTDISVGDIKTGGGSLTVEADFDKGGNPGIFTLLPGKSVSTGVGAFSLTATDVVLNGTVNAGDMTMFPPRGGTIGIGNTPGAMTLDGTEMANITAASLTVGNHLNDNLTVDGVTAAESQNISGPVTLNVAKPFRDILFENNPSTFNSLAANSAQDIFIDQPLTAAGALSLTANHDIVVNNNVTTGGTAVFHADEDRDGHGDFTIPFDKSFASIISSSHPVEIRANDFILWGTLNAGTAPLTLLISDGGTIRIGDGAGDMNVLNFPELEHMTAGSFTVGDSAGGNIELNGVNEIQTQNLGPVTLNATGAGRTMTFLSNGSHFSGGVTLNAADGIFVNKNFETQTAGMTINADSDHNGVGDLSVADGISVTSHSHAIAVTANDLAIGNLASVTSGSADMTIGISDGGVIGLGNASADMSLSNAELSTLKAGNLVIGNSDNSAVTVDGVNGANLANIFTSLSLNATGASGAVNFSNNASTFAFPNASTNFLSVNAGNGININANVAMNTGDFKANADQDASGAGSFNVAPGAQLSVSGTRSIDVTASDFILNGTLNAGANGNIILQPIKPADTIGLNNSTGILNLASAELNHLSALDVTLGRSDGTGQIDIGSLGALTIANPYNLSLRGGDILFHNRLTLANNQTLTLNGGTISGSVLGRDVNITGGTGTLALNTSGPVALDTLIDRLGTSTIGGSLDLVNRQTLNATGVVNVNGHLNLISPREIDINNDFTTNGATVITADSDRNGSGNFVLGTNGHLLTNDHPLQITANDYLLTSGGTISSGSADTTLLVSDGGTLNVGQGASGNATITHNELKQITAANLTIGDNTNADITVTGVNEVQTGNIPGTITLNATGAARSVIFSTNGSTFQNSVVVNAGNGITLNKNLKTLDGTITLNADSDGNGAGDLTIADNTVLNSNSHDILIKANDINLNTTAQTDSFKAPTTILVSDGGTIGLGNAVGDMAISGSELQRIKATGLTIGDNTNGDITVDGMTAAQSQNNMGDWILNATKDSSSIHFAGNDTTISGLRTSFIANAGTGIDVNKNLTTQTGGIDLHADFDANGTGDVTVADGTTVNSGNNLLQITAHDLNLNTTGALNSGAGETHITARGNIGVGDTPQDLTVDASELGRITAASLTLNAPQGNITVDHAAGPTATILNATASTGVINFINNPSSFKALAVNASDGISVNQNVTVNSGDFLANADFDGNGIGSFSLTSPTEIKTFLNHLIQITAEDIDLAGTLDTGRTGTVLLQPSAIASSTGLNDTTGSFNLTEAELNHLISSGPETPDVSVTIGRSGGTGEIQIGSLGPLAITEPYNLTLRGGNISFNNALALADNQTLALNGASVNGPVGLDVQIGGGAGTLLLNTSGPVTLNTSVDRLAASTVGGDLKITNDKNLAVTGLISTQAANGDMDFEVGTNTFTMNPGTQLKSGSGDNSVTGDGIDLNGGAGSVVGLGKIFLQPGQAGTSIGVAGGAGTLQLTNADLAALHKDFELISIGRPDGFGAVTIDAVTFVDPVTFLSPATGGSITVDGLITNSAPVTFEGSGATTTLNAGISTSGYDILIHDSVELGADVTLSTQTSANRAGKIQIDGSLNGARNLTANAGKGQIIFNGPVGDTAPVGSGTGFAMDLSTTDNGLTIFNSTLQTNSGIHSAGPVKFTGDVTLGDGDTVTALDGKITLDGLNFHAADGAQFGGSNSDLITLSSGPVAITSTDSPLIFNGWLNGPQDLTLDSGTAETKFNTDAGTLNSLDANRIGDGTGFAVNLLSTGTTTFERLRTHSGIQAAGPVTFNRDVIAGDGDTVTILNGNVVLSGLNFTAADGATFGDSSADSVTLEDDKVSVNSTDSPLTFNASVNGAQNLTLNSGTGTTEFKADLGNSQPIGGGTGQAINSNSKGLTVFDGFVTTNSEIKIEGPVTFKKDVTLGAGNNPNSLFNSDVNFEGINFKAARKVDFGNNLLDHINVSGSNTVSTTGNDGSLIFHGLLEGPGDVTLVTQGLGDITFAGAVGGLTPLNTLIINTAHNFNFPILSTPEITANALAASAANGIGTPLNPLLTAVGKLEVSGGTGGVFVTNTGSLAIGGISSLAGVSASAGSIQIFTHSPMTVNESITETGGADITLAALGSSSLDDLTVNAGVETSGGNGNINLISGDATAINSGAVKTSGTGNINLNAGEDFTDGILDQDGSVTGDVAMGSAASLQSALGNILLNAPRDIVMTDGAVANAGSGKINLNAGRDIALASAQTTSDATDAVIVRAGGAITDAGDTHPEILTGPVSGTTTLIAGTGIGSLNPLETSARNLSAVTEAGNLRIHNTGALDIVNANGVNGVSILDPLNVNGGGFIEVTAASPLTLDTAVINQAGGNIALSSLGVNPADDLTLGADVITTGKISLSAGDAVSQTGGILSADTLEANAGTTATLEKTDNDVNILNGTSHGLFSFVDKNDLAIGLVNAGSGSVTLTAGGSLTDANGALNNFTGGLLTLNAVTGIGSSDALETSVSSVNLKNTTSGNIAVDQIAGAGNLDVNQADQQGAGNVTLRTLGNSDINIKGNTTAVSGNIEVTSGRDIAMTDGKRADAGSGKIKFTAGQDLKLSSLKTTSNATDAVIAKATNGEITDAGDTDPEIVTGSVSGTATLIAKTGIGSADPLETAVRRLSAVTDTGNLRIHNTGALDIVNANGVNGVSILDPLNVNGGGFIEVTAASPMNVNSPVTNNAGGDIALASLGSNPADDLAINANIGTNGGNGNINLVAGDSVNLSSGVQVSAAKKGTIRIAAGEDFTDKLFNQNGNTGTEGGDIVMGLTASVLTEEGDIWLDAADDLALGVVDADSNRDKKRGDVHTFSRAGLTTDANGSAPNINAHHLTMLSSGNIGSKLDPIDISNSTQINNPSRTSFPQCLTSPGRCLPQRFIKRYKLK